MDGKQWRTCRLMLDGRALKVRYSEQAIEALFCPLLRRLSQLHEKKRRRILLFIAGPTGVGKTALALFLEKLAQMTEGMEAVQTADLRAFRHRAEYMATHTILRNGKKLPLRMARGCPEAYDLAGLLDKLSHIQEEGVRFPVYERNTHESLPDVALIRKPIVVMTGNWLLLGEGDWPLARSFADYTLMLTAAPATLRARLVEQGKRKGLTEAEVLRHYEEDDEKNDERVLKRSWPADETWIMTADGDYARKQKPRPLYGRERAAFWKRPNVEIDDPYFLRTMNERLAGLKGGNASGDSYEKGFVEGLVRARGDIVRKLHENGMDEKTLRDTFHVLPEELAAILRGKES